MEQRSLISDLDGAVPGFGAYLASGENHFDDDNPHGVFAACSHLVRNRAIQPESWERLAAIVNRVVGGEDAELDNAACTCFLENLASPSHPMKPWLRDAALAYWLIWE
jgi:hypothetical protein